jgi:hypothetical protein
VLMVAVCAVICGQLLFPFALDCGHDAVFFYTGIVLERWCIKAEVNSEVVCNTILTSNPTMFSNLNRSRRTTSIAQSPDGTSVSSSVTPPDTWVEVDISSTDYARRRRELMEMMNDLRSMG